MTTAVVAALLHYLGVVNLSSFSEDQSDGRKDASDLDIVHVIAQTAHCIAQGKVGSGFDVSSAVYGSQRYVRFSPEVLSSAQVILVHPIYLINLESKFNDRKNDVTIHKRKRNRRDDFLYSFEYK